MENSPSREKQRPRKMALEVAIERQKKLGEEAEVLRKEKSETCNASPGSARDCG